MNTETPTIGAQATGILDSNFSREGVLEEAARVFPYPLFLAPVPVSVSVSEVADLDVMMDDVLGRPPGRSPRAARRRWRKP